MTERERWIVYPLLFLALGAALRDKVVDRTISKSIRCQELVVVDDERFGGEPVPLARIGRAQETSRWGPVELKLNGTVNANQYLFRGLPTFPILQSPASSPVAPRTAAPIRTPRDRPRAPVSPNPIPSTPDDASTNSPPENPSPTGDAPPRD